MWSSSAFYYLPLACTIFILIIVLLFYDINKDDESGPFSYISLPFPLLSPIYDYVLRIVKK